MTRAASAAGADGAAAETPAPMHASPRCGARTRAGTPCRAPAVAGKHRCRMHGGARGTGAPKGNRNALKHGRMTAAAKAERRHISALIRASRRVMAAMGEGSGGGSRSGPFR